MTFAYSNSQENHEYNVPFERTSKDKSDSRRRNSYSRSGGRPVSHNGIHRRRNKRFAW